MLSKLKALWATVAADMKDTWNRSKMIILAILALVVTLEFRKLTEFLIAYTGQKEINKDKKEDQVLATKESTENAQADALVQQAQEEPSKEQPVDDNWYKKDPQ